MPDDRRSRMLAVLLGASTFSDAPTLAEGRAFYMSAVDVKEYLSDEQGLALPGQNILWLFDDSRSPSDQLIHVAKFLVRRTRELSSEGSRAEDLLIYYVGHGLFTRGDQAYCLAVRSTNEINVGATSIRAGDLAGVVMENAAFLRRYLILDCCFAAKIHQEFQSGALSAARVQIANEFPQRGTALLCSSNAREPSLAPQGLEHTMFSHALLQALRNGHEAGGPRLSFGEVGDLIKENLRNAYPESWVRPEVHSPDQREGDIAHFPLFPNSAFRKRSAVADRSSQPGNGLAERERGEDGSVRQFSKKACVLKDTLNALSMVFEVAFSPDGRLLASGGKDKSIKLWAVSTGELQKTLTGHTGEVSSLAFSHDGRFLASAGNWELIVWDIHAQSPKHILPAPKEILPPEVMKFKTDRTWHHTLNYVAVSPDGCYLAHGGSDGHIRIVDVSTGELKGTLEHGSQIHSVAFNHDGRLLVSAGSRKLVSGVYPSGEPRYSLKFWDMATNALTRTLTQDCCINSIAFSPDGRLLAVGNQDGTVILWDVASGAILRTLSGPQEDVFSVAFSPLADLLAAGSKDTTLTLWEVGTGQLRQTLFALSMVFSVAFSPDGRLLAAATQDWEIKLWKL